MKSIVAAAIGALCLIGFPVPCDAQAREKELKIGVVTLQMRAPFFVAVVRALEGEAPVYKNVKMMVADGGGDVAKVGSDIEDLLAKGVDGFIMNISPLEALPGPLDAIKKAGKPVVLLNRKLKGGEYNTWIGADNLSIGAGVGEHIAQKMNGKGTLLMMRGGPEDNSTGNARRDGVLSKVKGTSINVVVAPEFGRWSEDGGIRVMEDMLAKHKQIDAVFCENDSMCLGAQKAIADAKRANEILVFGIDGQKAALEQIMKGTNYTATGLNSAEILAKIGFARMMAILAGAVPEKDTATPVIVITKENVAAHYNPKSIF
jgi:ribose transport system substrate-binding protein